MKQTPTLGPSRGSSGPASCAQAGHLRLQPAHAVLSLSAGGSSDSDTEAGTAVLNLKPRARRFLPEPFSKGPQPCSMEWTDEAGLGPGRPQPCAPLAPRSKEGATQTPGVLRQPLLAKGQFGPVWEDSATAGDRPRPPPRLVRRASEPGGRKACFGGERP